ncbi:TIM-barrel-protein domain-containing protein [Phyllosticta citrichinensis]|uniref:TIM-barrel-protein domain-containing protein n=1 Tax=Phyllosticta citrichinensis TaxID=1130410 RepID=A0ABR1XX15_9PEZI
MPPPTDRREILAKLRSQVDAGRPIVGAGAGIGLSAKFIEEGGGDLIVIYNSGRYRMAGRGSLAGLMPYGSANKTVEEMTREIQPILSRTPLLAGLCATDPFLPPLTLLPELRRLGIAGIQNFPTVGLIDGNFRAQLEATGMSYGAEVDMIRDAHALDILTTPYVFDPEQAAAMARAGADVVVAHMGLTTGGSIGATAGAAGKTLEQCVDEIQAIRDAAVAVRSDVLVLCHGGPISAPDDARFVLSRTKGVHGFYGASSIERLPVETAITNTMKEFKGVELA